MTTAPQTALAIANFQPAQSIVLSRALVNLRASLHQAAAQNVQALVAQEDGYTETEIQAMTLVEELRQVNGLDLAAILMRAELIRSIERTNALANHPGQYQTMQDMARDQGISITELSQTLDLANIIFPYVQNTLGMPVAHLWEQIGKSGMKELIPVLKVIITGEPSPTNTVNASVDRLLDDATATLRAAGMELDDEGNFVAVDPDENGQPVRRNVHQNVIEQLLEEGATLPVRELRQRIRPERTPSIHASVIRTNGHRTLVCEMDEGQWEMFMRRVGNCLDPLNVQLPDDPRQRQVEAARIPELRALLRLLEG